jgi:hypothetical protein
MAYIISSWKREIHSVMFQDMFCLFVMLAFGTTSYTFLVSLLYKTSYIYYLSYYNWKYKLCTVCSFLFLFSWLSTFHAIWPFLSYSPSRNFPTIRRHFRSRRFITVKIPVLLECDPMLTGKWLQTLLYYLCRKYKGRHLSGKSTITNRHCIMSKKCSAHTHTHTHSTTASHWQHSFSPSLPFSQKPLNRHYPESDKST